MFHVMRNTSIRETELLRALGEALGKALPAPDGTTGKAIVEAKRVVEPRDVPSVVRSLGR